MHIINLKVMHHFNIKVNFLKQNIKEKKIWNSMSYLRFFKVFMIFTRPDIAINYKFCSFFSHNAKHYCNNLCSCIVPANKNEQKNSGWGQNQIQSWSWSRGSKVRMLSQNSKSKSDGRIWPESGRVCYVFSYPCTCSLSKRSLLPSLTVLCWNNVYTINILV